MYFESAIILIGCRLNILSCVLIIVSEVFKYGLTMPHYCFYCFLDNEKYKLLKIYCQHFNNMIGRPLKYRNNTVYFKAHFNLVITSPLTPLDFAVLNSYQSLKSEALAFLLISKAS